MQLNLKKPEPRYWEALAQAFLSEQELRNWGGPHLRLPLNLNQLDSQLDLAKWETRFVLSEPEQALVGFGQYQNRFQRCHLGRLFIWPHERNKGIGSLMIQSLARSGCQQFQCTEVSLWVLAGNPKALSLYRRLGFLEIPYPAPDPFSNSFFMAISLERLLAG